MDRAAIFSDNLKRNALRRGAKLLTLNVQDEYRRLVEVARWAEIMNAHYVRVRDEILGGFRARDPAWGYSAGGRMALHSLTLDALRERYGQTA